MQNAMRESLKRQLQAFHPAQPLPTVGVIRYPGFGFKDAVASRAFETIIARSVRNELGPPLYRSAQAQMREMQETFRKRTEAQVRQVHEAWRKIADTAGRRAAIEETLFAAYEAWNSFERGDWEKLARFLRDTLRTRYPNRDHAVALWEVLQVGHEELVALIMSDDEHTPAQWLALRVAFRFGDMNRELDPRDKFCMKTREAPLDREDVDDLLAMGLAEGRVAKPEAPGLPAIRPRKPGMRPLSQEDPFLLVPAWHGDERQALEEISAKGHPRSRPRARNVLDYYDRLRWSGEQFDPAELLRAAEGENGLRALRTTARGRLMGIRDEKRRKKMMEELSENSPDRTLPL